MGDYYTTEIFGKAPKTGTPKLVSKQQNKQSKPKFIPKDQAAKDSIEANVYNDQTVQDTKPGKYVQKNGKTVWVPDRTKHPYKKQIGGSLDETPSYQNESSLTQGLDSALRKKSEDATRESMLQFARERGVLPLPTINSNKEYNEFERRFRERKQLQDDWDKKLDDWDRKLQEIQANRKRYNVENIRKTYPYLNSKIFKNGGSLNEIPFMQKGTPKNGIRKRVWRFEKPHMFENSEFLSVKSDPDQYGRYVNIERMVTPRYNGTFDNDTSYASYIHNPYGVDLNLEHSSKNVNPEYKSPKQVLGAKFNTWGEYFKYLLSLKK